MQPERERETSIFCFPTSLHGVEYQKAVEFGPQPPADIEI